MRSKHHVQSGAVAKNQRREDAQARVEVHSERSLRQQIEALDDRLGKGIGAAKERAHLSALLTTTQKKRKKEKNA